jgi:formate dehydrogenase subunit gamma
VPGNAVVIRVPFKAAQGQDSGFLGHSFTNSDVTPGWDAHRAGAIIAAHEGEPGAMLPILHDLQAEFGCVPKAAEALIASALNLSRAEVLGVISFYHDFRRAPAGRHVLKICRAEACQSMGAVALAESALRQAGIGWGDTTADGHLTIEQVFCLGLCACAPAALLDGEPIGRLSPDHVTDIVREAAL